LYSEAEWIRNKSRQKENVFYSFKIFYNFFDRLCGLVVRVLGYRSGDPGSIPGTTRFSEKKKEYWV
jgi:hypothetical protein